MSGPAGPEPAEPVSVAAPVHGAALLGFLGKRTIAGVETYSAVPGRQTYRRTLRLAHGPGIVQLAWDGSALSARYGVDPRDRAAARTVVRALCDADHDPVAAGDRLAADPQLAPLVRAAPGLRMPGAVALPELAFRALIGQQISLAAAATCAAKLTDRFGGRIEGAEPGLDRLFPEPAELAAADPDTLPMPRARSRALVELAATFASGGLAFTPDTPPPEVRAELLRCRGIGPWTADYVLLRARHAPDILLDTDLVVARQLVRLGLTHTAGWSPWRSYATMHLWHASGLAT